MKDNYVILDEKFDPNTGYYYIKINTALGTFDAFTEPDKVDSQYLSAYHASEIVLAKALRKFGETAIAKLKSEVRLIEKMRKQVLDNVGEVGTFNTAYKTMVSTVNQLKADILKWENRVNSLAFGIQERIAARDKIVAKYATKEGQN